MSYEHSGDAVELIANLGAVAAEPHQLEPGRIYAVATPEGTDVEVINLDDDKYRDHPIRKSGMVQVFSPTSFNDYVNKHAMGEETEIFCDPVEFAVTAVINSHGTGQAGWGDHRCRLVFTRTEAWKKWAAANNEWMSQLQLAELVEERSIDFVTTSGGPDSVIYPSAADMLELAQTIQVSRSAEFESSQRLKSGETTLKYVENLDGKAGRRGELVIPDYFALALQPFEGSKPFFIRARFRYRFHDKQLTLGFLLERPEDVLRAAFDANVTQIRDEFDPATSVFNEINIYEGPAKQ